MIQLRAVLGAHIHNNRASAAGVGDILLRIACPPESNTWLGRPRRQLSVQCSRHRHVKVSSHPNIAALVTDRPRQSYSLCSSLSKSRVGLVAYRRSVAFESGALQVFLSVIGDKLNIDENEAANDELCVCLRSTSEATLCAL